MEQWNNKVALVTGASSGIGKAIAEVLVSLGMKVVGFARRVENMKTLAEQWQSKSGKLYPIQVDLQNSQEILRAMQWIEKNLGNVDVLVNNAAVDWPTTFLDGSFEEWKKTFDVNVLGLVDVTKQVLSLKKRKGSNTGIIININDTWGFRMPTIGERPIHGPYIASKFALRAITDILRLEFAQLESKIKVTSITPGLVETEMTTRSLKEHPRLALKPRDIAESLHYILSVPNTVQVKELVLTPIREIL